jgi:hypothetical protein
MGSFLPVHYWNSQTPWIGKNKNAERRDFFLFALCSSELYNLHQQRRKKNVRDEKVMLFNALLYKVIHYSFLFLFNLKMYQKLRKKLCRVFFSFTRSTILNLKNSDFGPAAHFFPLENGLFI